MDKVMSFIKEAKAEMKKVTWPGRQQIWYSTLVVIAMVLIVTVYLGLADTICAAFYKAIFA